MRILIYALNFAPEPVGCGKYTGELAAWLARRGHDVRVVTTPAHYPSWTLAPGSPRWFYRLENWNGIRVWRCPIWVPATPTALKRLIYLFGFACSSFPLLISQIFWRPAVVWTLEPTLFGAPAAIFAARLCGAKSWLHVQDFELDMAFEMRFLNSGALRALAEFVEKRLLLGFGRISSISPKMLERLAGKGVPASKISYFPNWVDTDFIRPLDRPSLLRREMSLPENAMVALYAGNMAAKQGLEIIVEAARALRDVPELIFVLAGDGPARTGLERLASGFSNCRWLPLQKEERLNELLNLADIHLLPQKAGAADLVMPSKLSGMLSSGRPVVACAAPGTQIALALESCGVTVSPGDCAALAAAVKTLAEDPRERRRLGENARLWALEHLRQDAILSAFEAGLGDLVKSGVGGK